MTYDEKLEIAKKLNIALREWHLNKERYDLIKKIYFAFVFQCLFLDKDEFSLSFNGKCIRSFLERTQELIRYFDDCLYLFILKYLTTEAFRYRITHFPKNILEIRANFLLCYGVYKPTPVKDNNNPDETSMNYYLATFFSLEIKKKFLLPIKTKYIIGPIKDQKVA